MVAEPAPEPQPNPLDKLDLDAILGHAPTLVLTEDELLLIDWCLSVYSHCLPLDLESVVEDWHPMRVKVWEAINSQVMPERMAKFSLGEEESKWLLGILPTTFRWGTSEDCGYSLKRKLSCYLMGKEYRRDPPANQTPQPNPTPSDSIVYDD